MQSRYGESSTGSAPFWSNVTTNTTAGISKRSRAKVVDMEWELFLGEVLAITVVARKTKSIGTKSEHRGNNQPGLLYTQELNVTLNDQWKQNRCLSNDPETGDPVYDLKALPWTVKKHRPTVSFMAWTWPCDCEMLDEDLKDGMLGWL